MIFTAILVGLLLGVSAIAFTEWLNARKFRALKRSTRTMLDSFEHDMQIKSLQKEVARLEGKVNIVGKAMVELIDELSREISCEVHEIELSEKMIDELMKKHEQESKKKRPTKAKAKKGGSKKKG